MKLLEEQFITDTQGRKISVIISMKNYSYILEELEELEDIRSYDKAKSKKNKTFIDAIDAFNLIENNRK